MINNRWNIFTEYVTKKFGIPKLTLDYIAVNDILFACVTGLSNKTISNKFNLNLSYIEETIMTFLKFKGWSDDLDINIVFMYEMSGKTFSSFIILVKIFTQLISDDQIKTAFDICKRYDRIIKRVDNYYERDK